MFKFFIIFITILSYISSSILVLPFKTYNPLITKDENLLKLIKNSNDSEIIKTIIQNLIYITLDIGKIDIKNKITSQKIDFFLNMDNYEFYINMLDKIYFDPEREFYPDLQYNNFTLLKSIINFTYYNISLSKSSFDPKYPMDDLEDLNLLNETINLSIKNKSINEKAEKKDIRIFISYKDSLKYDHRPGLLGLYFRNKFISDLKDKVSLKSNDWIIKYTDCENEEGELIIGGLPHEFDSQHFNEDNLRNSKVYIEDNMHPIWSLKFIKSFIISNEDSVLNEINLEINKISSFKIDEFFILGTDEYYNIIQKIFFNEYIEKGICQKQTHKKSRYVKDYYHFMCYFNRDNQKRDNFLKNFPSLKFYQNEMNYNFTLNSTDLFTIIPDNNRVLFNVEFLEGYDNWVFGKSFFKKYQLIFDDDANIIKFYIDNEKENSDNSNDNEFSRNLKYYIIIFVLVVIFFILGIYIVKKFFEMNSKKKALELTESLDDKKIIND